MRLGPERENILGHPSRTFLFHLEPDKGTTFKIYFPSVEEAEVVGKVVLFAT